MIFDFLFRSGNPTHDWDQSPYLKLTAELDVPSLQGVALGSPFEALSFLGRSDRTEMEMFCYFELGIGIERDREGMFDGFSIILQDEDETFQPFGGTLYWKNTHLDSYRLSQTDLHRVLGEWYWLDDDEDESIVFFEFPNHELQVELNSMGDVKRLILTKSPLMADPVQREVYKVDKPWPPAFAGA